MRRYLLLFVAVLLAACSTFGTPAVMPTATVPFATATVVMPTPLPTKTLMPYEQYTIDHLRQRAYGGGRIEILEKLSETDLFTSYSIRYPSDGLNIYGFVNIPKGEGPFPVIVSIRGFSPYGRYDPFVPASDAADFFAANQFIVIHPGLRNYPPSDTGDNLLRVGMSIDVMNLIALLKQKSDLPVELSVANADQLGLWGTSLGGEIALRILTVSPDIQAAVMYSTLSGDPQRNSKHLYDVVRDDEFLLDEQIPLELHDRVSPMNYYYRITAAIQLHHGTADETAPISWAAETCDFLQGAGISVQCNFYKDADHMFREENTEKMLQNALEFYRAHLAP